MGGRASDGRPSLEQGEILPKGFCSVSRDPWEVAVMSPHLSHKLSVKRKISEKKNIYLA